MNRKRRTRQHVIADLSVNHVERLVFRGGHTVERVLHDYGYDLIVFTYDEEGYCDPGLLFVQVKATENLRLVGSDIVFDVDMRDYDRWRVERVPVILVLYEAASNRAFWLHVQEYERLSLRNSRAGAKSVRVRFSMDQRLSLRAMQRWRNINRSFRLRVVGRS